MEEIKNDFPGIPCLANRDLKRNLAKLAKRLIRAQLLTADVPDAAFRFAGKLGEPIEAPELDGDRLRISDSAYVRDVSSQIFEFNLAGYQPSKNWVSAGNKSGIQRRGTLLRRGDAQTYRQVLFAIQETIKVRALIDEVIEEHGGWPEAFRSTSELAVTPGAMPRSKPHPHVIPLDDSRVKKEAYRTLLPVYTLRAAAGYFGNGESVESEGWLEATDVGVLDERMFVARAMGRSMEPVIHDGDLLVFRRDPSGTRQGKIVLAQYRGSADPETGGSFTVKQYSGEKVAVADDEGGWRHTRITLSPLNPDFSPIEILQDRASDFRILAEFVAVLGR